MSIDSAGSARLRNVPVPPPGFDALAADHDTLVSYGLPHRPIDPDQLELWELVLSQPIEWLPPKFLSTERGRPRRGRGVNPDNPFTWCGAVAEEPSLSGTFVNVSAIWTVPPRVDPEPDKAGEWYCSSWVGLDDGNPGGYLWQAGAMSTVQIKGDGSPGIQSDFLWTEFYLAQTFAEAQTTPEPSWVPLALPVEAGDQIACAVAVDPPAADAQTTTVSCWMANLTRRKGMSLIYDVAAFSAQGAEWIVERPQFQSLYEGQVVDHYGALPDYHTIIFSYCGAGLADKTMVNLSSATSYDMMGGDDGLEVLSEAAIDSPSELTCTWRSYGP